MWNFSWDDDKFLEIHSSDVNTIMYLMPLNLHFKMVEILNFMSCIFYFSFFLLETGSHSVVQAD